MIDLLWHDAETELNTHPFPKLLLQKLIEMSKRLEAMDLRNGEDSFTTIRTSKEFTDEDRLSLEMHLLLQEVHFKIDRLQQCAMILDFYPDDIRTAWFTPLTRGEYLEQIMELYIMHSIGLVDRVLILYNYLFDLKLSDHKRTLESVIRKLPKEDGFPLFAFSAIFKEVRKSRNVIAHEYRYIDNEIIDLVLQDTLARDKYRASMPKAQKIFDDINKKYDKKELELRQDMIENDKILTRVYMPVLAVMERRYHEKIKELHIPEPGIQA